MASYTTTLRRLMDPEANTAGYSWVKGHYENGVWVPAQINKNSVSTNFELWDTGTKAYPLIFDDPNWEGYDPTFRAKLNDAIVDFYWGYEIGSETPSMFKQRINQKMRLIMPYYNLLFKAEWEQFKDFNPNTFKKEKEYQGGMERKTGERKDYDWSGNKTNDHTDTGKQYNFDTPQNMGSLNVNSPDHMSSASTVESNIGAVITQNGNYTSGSFDASKETFKSAEATDTDTYKNRKDIETGYTTSPYTQYKEYLETVRNIEEMIIDELRDCFMLVY